MGPKVLAWSSIAAATVLIVGLAPVRAQSLADVARAEEARRKQITQHAKVYTNKDLVSVPPPAAPAPGPASTDPATAGAGNEQAAKDEKADPDRGSGQASDDASKTPPRGQAYWSGRMKALLDRLDQDHVLADALQSRINALTADFSARDDPAQRRVIGMDRQKALDELDRLNKSLLNDQKAIADLQEEARRASVPPGWLR